MAQSGFTPLLTYGSTTASNQPSAGNLTTSANGVELAVNAADGKLFYKDTGGVVQVLATKAGASGDVVGPASATANAIALFDGTTGKLIKDSAATLPAGSLVGTTATQTLTNKRIDPRVSSAASASSVTPDISSFDQYAFTALAADLTINAPTGTPVDGNKLVFRILDNGTTRNLTWNATYTVIGTTLPTATTANKMIYVGCIYNAANSRWDVVAVTTQA